MVGVSKAQRHNGAKTPLYGVWKQMRLRCNSPTHANYDRYGGRGIQVCARWNGSFAAFVADMGPCPIGLTLEREDNDGDYEPGNCIWASRKTQNRNRRTCRYITVDGVTRTVIDWCDVKGISPTMVYNRLHDNWSEQDAVTVPVFARTRWTNQPMEK